MTEADLEMLETYLDDALSDRELAEAARRIATEPELAAELEQMRAQRDLRRRLFATLEPTDASVERLLGRVDESIRRRSWFERQLKWGTRFAAAAACIVLGLSVGYIGRGPAAPSGVATNSGGPARQNPSPVIASNTGANGAPADPHGKINFVARLTDDAGRVIAEQPFESADKATEFVHDIQQWNDRQRQVQNGNYVVTGGKF